MANGFRARRRKGEQLMRALLFTIIVTLAAAAQKIDAKGKIVTPGLINSITELGVVEIGQVRDTNDVSARGTNNIAAAFKVWDGLNSASAVFAPTRNEGVTSV